MIKVKVSVCSDIEVTCTDKGGGIWSVEPFIYHPQVSFRKTIRCNDDNKKTPQDVLSNENLFLDCPLNLIAALDWLKDPQLFKSRGLTNNECALCCKPAGISMRRCKNGHRYCFNCSVNNDDGCMVCDPHNNTANE